MEKLQFPKRLGRKDARKMLELLNPRLHGLILGVPNGERGPLVGATQQLPALAGYRDKVRELIEGGTAFGDIEDAIDVFAGLTTDQKDALWLFAFTLRERGPQQRETGAHLLAVL